MAAIFFSFINIFGIFDEKLRIKCHLIHIGYQGVQWNHNKINPTLNYYFGSF